MNYEVIKVRDWRLIFTGNSPRNVWFRMIPKQRFTHCELVGTDGFCWVSVLPANAAFTVQTLAYPADLKPEQWKEAGVLPSNLDIEVVKPPRFRPKRPRVFLFAPWTCVEVCKAALNMSHWYIVTPDQLHQFTAVKGRVSVAWKIKNIGIAIAAHTIAIVSNLIASPLR